LIIRFV